MDEALRNRLWNLLTSFYWDKGLNFPLYDDLSQNMHTFVRNLWHNYFKLAFSGIGDMWPPILDAISKYYFKCGWNNVYDFIEFVANNYPDEEINKQFVQACNDVLESDLSAYRFVGKQITPITSENEIAEIEEATSSPFESVNTHLESGLKLMSDRTSPDYRNSIKESISAVEALCRIVTKDNKATLGKALDVIEKEGKIELHGALKKAFDSLYGYTSSAEGIRHSLLDEKTTLSFEDAKFMLVSCSTFVNYLITKASKAGLTVG